LARMRLALALRKIERFFFNAGETGVVTAAAGDLLRRRFPP
jgi:hypothetical protein